MPVVEIEGLLFRHPAIQAVAIVGYPDPRLGERACAFVVLKAGRAFSQAEIIQFLEQEKLVKQYMPERLEIVAELPRTPSGKVQKFRLREIERILMRSQSLDVRGHTLDEEALLTSIKTYTDLLYDEQNGIATITINRPEKYNAFRGLTSMS